MEAKIVICQAVTDIPDSMVPVTQRDTILLQAPKMILHAFLELPLADIDVAEPMEHLSGSNLRVNTTCVYR